MLIKPHPERLAGLFLESSNMRMFLLLFCLALPLGADSGKLYVGSLSPSQRFSLFLGNDKSASLHFVDDKKVFKASGPYTWVKNELVIKVKKAEPFVLEIRRKGVDTPPPRMEVKTGAILRWQTEIKKDQLVLEGPPGWQLPLYIEH